MLSVAVQGLGFVGMIFALLTIRHELRRLRRGELKEYQRMFHNTPILVYITNSTEAKTNSAEPKTSPISQ